MPTEPPSTPPEDIRELLDHWTHVYPAAQRITTPEAHAAALARYEALFAHRDAPPAAALLELVGERIHEYESGRYALTGATPAAVLAYLMQSNDLTQSALASVTCIDQGTISKLLSGARSFSKTHARRLATYFSVPVELFMA